MLRESELYYYKMLKGSDLYSYKMLRGSEHQIGGRPFPLELHLVHFNSKYGEIGENSLDQNFLKYGCQAIMCSLNPNFIES